MTGFTSGYLVEGLWHSLWKIWSSLRGDLPPNLHSVTILCMSFITENFQLLNIGFQEMAIFWREIANSHSALYNLWAKPLHGKSVTSDGIIIKDVGL